MRAHVVNSREVKTVLVVVSRGWGAWVIPIIIGTTAAVFMLCKAAAAALDLQSGSEFALPLALSVAAICNWCLGRHLNGKPAEDPVDAKTGERPRLQPRHDMYTVRMEYWSIPVVLFAIFKVAGTIMAVD